jgi:hypothetical protein
LRQLKKGLIVVSRWRFEAKTAEISKSCGIIPHTMPAERPIPIPAEAIFTVGKTPHPQDEAIKQMMGGVMERLGKIEDMAKRGSITSNIPEARIETPDISQIPLWQGRRQDGRGLDFLQAHYGQWLSAFGAAQDNVFQDQIRKHDPKILQGVTTQLRGEGQNRKIRDFVKPRSVRTDREFADINPEALKHADRLSAAMKMRQVYKARKSPRPSSA